MAGFRGASPDSAKAIIGLAECIGTQNIGLKATRTHNMFQPRLSNDLTSPCVHMPVHAAHERLLKKG
jgi:hypothetical protein